MSTKEEQVGELPEEDEWPDILHESREEYGRLSDAMDELKDALTEVIESGLMTEELRDGLLKLAESSRRRLVDLKIKKTE